LRPLRAARALPPCPGAARGGRRRRARVRWCGAGATAGPRPLTGRAGAGCAQVAPPVLARYVMLW